MARGATIGIAHYTSSVFEIRKLKAPKLEKNIGSGKWEEAAIFDNWVNDAIDILEVRELDPGPGRPVV